MNGIDTRVTLDIGAVARTYLLHVPATAAGSAPLVVMLHGAGGSGSWARDESLFDRTADREGFVAVYPDALAIDPSKPASFLKNPQVWNSGAGPGLIRNRTHDDAAFLAAVIDDVAVRTSIDPARVFMSGFSNGAAMTFSFASQLPARVAAIAPVAGLCPEVIPVARPMPTLFIVGDSDPLLPLAGGEVRSPWTGQVKVRGPLSESLGRWARAIGVDSGERIVAESEGVRTVDWLGESVFRIITIAGLGHHWPGGRGRLKRSLAGLPSNRMNANAVIWEFFQKAVR